ncbi:hypothetical protein [Streptomyces sp. NPDC012888]|uniref:hypothetical protein n=1 Tax=Streptomyces sp. NPDC012888 TaxID=3364855 RepID=UPI0036AF1D68
MPDPKDSRSPLEQVTGENDMTPEEERQRKASRSDDRSRGPGMAQKLKEAAEEVMGTGKPEAPHGTRE